MRSAVRARSLVLAFLTGEGWHNNHHPDTASARQGFFWWELDPTYYGLRLLAALGLIHGLKPVPVAVRDSVNRVAGGRR
jgi:stearoyl-CoA desaturase (delta-9 desaturase)